VVEIFEGILQALNKREEGNLQDFANLAIGVVVVVVIIALGFLVLAQFQSVNVSSFSNDTNVWQSVQDGNTNLSTLSGFVAVVVIVAVVAVVISLVGAFGIGRGGM